MFEFKSKEEREAWRVLKPCYKKGAGSDVINGRNWTGVVTAQEFDEAAARFDEREATCGIEPLSEEHFALGCANGTHIHAREMHTGCVHAVYDSLVSNGLVWLRDGYNGYRATDKGRAVLQKLNAMCKVER